MLVWIENAPTLEINSEEEIVQFVDNILHVMLIIKKLQILSAYKHTNIQYLAERRENQYVGLDFHCLHTQEQCCCILLQKINTKSFKK